MQSNLRYSMIYKPVLIHKIITDFNDKTNILYRIIFRLAKAYILHLVHNGLPSLFINRL